MQVQHRPRQSGAYCGSTRQCDAWRPYHFAKSSNHPLFIFADDTDEVNLEKKTITWEEGMRAMHRVGKSIVDLVGNERGAVIGVLANKGLSGILSATSNVNVEYFPILSQIRRLFLLL